MKNKDLPPRLIREAEEVGDIAANLSTASDEELGLALEWLEARKLKKSQAFVRCIGEAMARNESRNDILADFQIQAMQAAQEKLDICQLYRLAAHGAAVARALEAFIGWHPEGSALVKNAKVVLAALRGRAR